MIFGRTRHSNLDRTRERSGRRRGVVVGAVGLCAGAALTGGGAAGAEPGTPSSPAPAPGVVIVDVPEAGSPMPVPEGSYGYTATHSVTARLSAMNTPEAIAALPVPTQYRPANAALAQRLDLALQGALADPRGCVQIIVDPHPGAGNLFDYGVYPVSGDYCP